jgi:hypothetical protein
MFRAGFLVIALLSTVGAARAETFEGRRAHGVVLVPEAPHEKKPTWLARGH